MDGSRKNYQQCFSSMNREILKNVLVALFHAITINEDFQAPKDTIITKKVAI